jgi:tetratricopeptide (TPR) repeat protein/DNA-binding XRE family transcriptional regulator
MTQEELAERAGLAVRTICDLERGRTTRPYPNTVVALAEALGLPGPQRADFVSLSRRGRGATPVESQPEPAESRGSAMVPRQLPAAVSHFTGRLGELEALSRVLGEGRASRTVVISALAGTAGVGKTALAVRWAHQVAERFPDGQLYVNLRGYDPAEPVTAADALASFLQALGLPGPQIPDGAEDRARTYRSMLAGRRMLVVLDNAQQAQQVRPLLPGDPGCAVVITSRDALAGLVAMDGARRLDLDLLPLADAVALLRLLIGDRVDQDLDAAAELAGLCARLPLALRIAAELIASRRQAALRELVNELTAGQLDALDVGEDRADVRAVISWSYRQLPDPAARAFALLGLHPGEDLDAHAAAALTGVSRQEARRVLGQLHRASLLQATGPGRYGMHDLLRAFAREQAAAADTNGQSEQALTRLFDYYLGAAVAAMDILFPAEARQRPRIEASAEEVPEMVGEAAGWAWLDAERSNLVAVVAHCASDGWPRHATSLARTLFRYLMNGSHLPEALIVYGDALRAARLSGDLLGEAQALAGLGGIGIMRGHSLDAAGNYQAALDCFRRCGDQIGEANSLINLGVTEQMQDDHMSAAGHYRQAVTAFEQASDSIGTARALASLAGAEAELDLLADAAAHLERALPVFLVANDHTNLAEALERMGEVNFRRGQLTEAAAFHEQALAAYRRVGHPVGEAAQLASLGEVRLRQGEYRQAIDYLRQARDLFRQVGNQFGELLTLRTLAEALQQIDEYGAARAELEIALRLATETGSTHLQAKVRSDLAEVEAAALA